ncbi:MAG: GNAT family N-acetyltransferase [Lachnospiraceae bacterium]|nr:GNAT family N-acetyltransferase [Lachnospiraceae bacterium]
MKYNNVMITDFRMPIFKTAFQLYFAELGVIIRQWDELFEEMTKEGGNVAYLCLNDDNTVIGFIQFKVISFSSYFFETKMGFIREFWVANEYRNLGHGTELLHYAEEYFINQGIYKSILTTDSAENFYLKRGYIKDIDIWAKNKDVVFIKSLR